MCVIEYTLKKFNCVSKRKEKIVLRSHVGCPLIFHSSLPICIQILFVSSTCVQEKIGSWFFLFRSLMNNTKVEVDSKLMFISLYTRYCVIFKCWRWCATKFSVLPLEGRGCYWLVVYLHTSCSTIGSYPGTVTTQGSSLELLLFKYRIKITQRYWLLTLGSPA
jgi:hypothetical protein